MCIQMPFNLIHHVPLFSVLSALFFNNRTSISISLSIPCVFSHFLTIPTGKKNIKIAQMNVMI